MMPLHQTGSCKLGCDEGHVLFAEWIHIDVGDVRVVVCDVVVCNVGCVVIDSNLRRLRA